MKVSVNSVVQDASRKTIFYPKTDVTFNASSLYQAINPEAKDYAHWYPLIETYCLYALKKVPISHECIPGGTFHLLYKIAFSETEQCIVRINKFPTLYMASDFVIDSWVYPFLKKHDIPVPKVISIDTSRDIIPTDIEILSYLPGNNLEMYCNKETQHMDPELLQNIGFLVAEIHSIDLAGFGPISLQSISQDTSAPQGLHAHWHNYIFLRLEDHIATCEKNKIISMQEASKIFTLFHAHKNLLTIMNPVLLHGDLGNHNLISTDGKTISGIIDWEDCMAGDPVFDIAFWGTFFKDHMPDEFLKGYTAVHTLSEDFHTRYWLYYLRIALSKTVHRHIFGYKDIKGRPPASARISKALSHF